MTLLSWFGVTKRFGNHAALADVNFTVSPGERIALVGANGSGKSTLLRVAAGLCRPTRGHASVVGEDVRRRPDVARRHLGYMPQAVEFPANVSVAELIEFFAKLRRANEARCDEVARQFGLVDSLEQNAGELSGGMTQRLALAVTLLAKPEVLILDEPTAGLDPTWAAEVRRVLRLESERGCAIVMATHQTEDIEEFADRVVMLTRGRLAADLSARRVQRTMEKVGTLRVVVDQASLLQVVASAGAG